MNILAIGAHPDDIEIGAGGALRRHIDHEDKVLMVVMSAGEAGGAEAKVRLKELRDSARTLGVVNVTCLEYPDRAVPANHEAIERVERAMKDFAPTRAYIPYWHEVHQDHRHTSEVAIAACRNLPQVLMYEGPSTFPEFQVDYWIDIAETIDIKLSALGKYVSQGEKDILKIDSIRSLNHFRGYQARTTYAEGFHIFRFIE
jgi:LmbE family N-acetylglucosaminyl deacetylase